MLCSDGPVFTLFDLDFARLHMNLDLDEIVHCFKEYTAFATGRKPTGKKVFLRNIEEKQNDPSFSGDSGALLGRETVYHQEAAFERLKSELIERI